MLNRDDLRLLQRRLEQAVVLIAGLGGDELQRESIPANAVLNVITALEDLERSLPSISPEKRFLTVHDGVVHNPLGSGSYLFKDNYIPPLSKFLDLKADAGQPTVVVHIGAQPNNSPHIGTITVFTQAFLLAREMKRYYRSKCGDELDVQVHLDIVDTAPDDSKTKIAEDGATYQVSHRYTNAMSQYLPDYEEVLKSLHDFIDHEVSYKITTQETLMRMPSIPFIVTALVKDRVRLGAELSPKRQVIALRRACPQPNCGYADKHGQNTTYATTPSGETIITFVCHVHGAHTVSLSDPSEVAQLEFNAPLRNLLRAIAYGQDTLESRQGNQPERLHLRVTGMDYAGIYQEQLLWRQLIILPTRTELPGNIPPPVIVYAPLILDWAGSKLSKSLYVVEGAYEYLRERGMDYLLSFKMMKERQKDINIFYREVERWVKEPKMLHRCFSVDYIHSVFEREASSTS